MNQPNVYPEERREIALVIVRPETAQMSSTGKSCFMEVAIVNDNGEVEKELGSIMLSMRCKEKLESLNATAETPIFAVLATELTGRFAGKPRMIWPAAHTEKDYDLLATRMMTSNRTVVVT